ncbi:MAG: GNAT family N-acetyltransferase [Candidatus Heimdallarchaeota archaeon]|nr:GNAT family N-acetyltransferase [Candidatus Heimdallarchaeota archaeon]
MSENQGKIILYSPDLAEKASIMFNSFNELWPGGFGGGVPYTEERVHDWLDKSSALADLIAIDGDGELCGYCGLYPHWRDKEAAYISILGVTPKAKGMKFGKRLLLKALEIAEQKGISRVDLHTWSGNLDAVPLYKKIGLFWVPETSVYMQDYIPGLMQSSIAKEWFAKHPNWYENFKRELSQAPDKEEIDKMEVFQYKFEMGDDLLHVEVDRFGWGFCGFERVLDGKRLVVNTRLASHDIYIGIPNTFIINLYNDYDTEIVVPIEVVGFQGLKWIEKFPKTIKLKKGESFHISRDFIIDKETKLFRDNQRSCDGIKTTIKLGKQNVNLITSGKLQSPLKLRSITKNRFKIIATGKETIFPLDMLNTTKSNIKGYIKITSDDLSDFKQEVPFDLTEGEISGFNVLVMTPENTRQNRFILNAVPFLKLNNHEIEMPTFQIPLFVNTKDLVELIEIEDTKTLHLITDKLAVQVNLEGGNFRISPLGVDNPISLSHQSGPPFGLSLDNTILCDYEYTQDGKDYLLKVYFKSNQVPDLLVEKFIKVSAGLNEIEYWVQFTNINNKKSIHASAKTIIPRDGLNLNPNSAKSHSYSPIKGKIIESRCTTNFMSFPILPTDPAIWDETWNVNTGLLYDDFSAWIWKPENVKTIRLNSGRLNQLESLTVELPPNKPQKMVHLWYNFGFNTIQEIRQRWSQLIGNQEFTPMVELIGPKITKDLEINLKGERILYVGQSVKKTIVISFASTYPLPGTLSLKLPENWHGYFITKNGKESTIPMPEVKPFSDVPLDIELTLPTKIQSQIENIQVHFTGEFEFNFDNFVLVTKKGTVDVKSETIDNGEVYSVSNGKIAFKIAAKKGGNLIRLEDENNQTFLMDNFPDIKPKFFLDYYMGGCQPGIFHANADEPFTEPELVTTEEIIEGDWAGVKSSWTIKNCKEYFYGQKAEIKYLTLPDSNIIRINLALENQTPRTISWMGLLLLDIGLQGSREGNIIEINDGKEIWYHNTIKHQPFINQSSFNNPYARISKGDQSLSLLIPYGTTGSSAIADLGVMLLGLMISLQYAQPNSKSEVSFTIMINQPSENMSKLVKVLKGYK